jgi:hypothetical protein
MFDILLATWQIQVNFGIQICKIAKLFIFWLECGVFCCEIKWIKPFWVSLLSYYSFVYDLFGQTWYGQTFIVTSWKEIDKFVHLLIPWQFV